jgi:hypothetical protein
VLRRPGSILQLHINNDRRRIDAERAAPTIDGLQLA